MKKRNNDNNKNCNNKSDGKDWVRSLQSLACPCSSPNKSSHEVEEDFESDVTYNNDDYEIGRIIAERFRKNSGKRKDRHNNKTGVSRLRVGYYVLT